LLRNAVSTLPRRAPISNDTFTKRQKERARQDRQREKRIEEDARKRAGAEGPLGEDPDIAGIVPGPQPPVDR
jgi:hypothetical protein